MVKLELFCLSVVVWFFLLVLMNFCVIMMVLVILGFNSFWVFFVMVLICGVVLLNLLFVCSIFFMLKFSVCIFCLVRIVENISEDMCLFIDSNWFFKLLWCRIFLWFVKLCNLLSSLFNLGLMFVLFFRVFKIVSLILIIDWMVLLICFWVIGVWVRLIR